MRLVRAVVGWSVVVLASLLITAGACGAAVASPGASALLRRLAVLRSPQISTDVLPAGTLPATEQRTLIPSLSRLVASVPGAEVYLVVFRAPPGSTPVVWNRNLGDLASLVIVTGHGTAMTFPVPAAHLSDGSVVRQFSDSPATTARYAVQLVPDGVDHVSWTFSGEHGTRPQVITALAADNAVVSSYPSTAPVISQTTWYGTDDAVIPTSDTALQRASAAYGAARREHLIRIEEKVRYRPSPALLAAFDIFSVTSRTGEKIGALTISHPRLMSVPLAVLVLAENRPHGLAHPELDPTDLRRAVTRSGTSIWIFPGRRGMCVFVDSGGGCSDDLAQTVSGGTGFTSGSAGHGTWHYGIKPDSRPTLTVSDGTHLKRTFHLTDGVYAYHTGPS